MYTQFGDKYRRWARIAKATMRITHKPGDAMQVDWAGDLLYIMDPVTGEEEPAYIFVAVLPCSWYTYAEPCSDMKSENWLLCHVHAFEYYGGVPRGGTDSVSSEYCRSCFQALLLEPDSTSQAYLEMKSFLTYNIPKKHSKTHMGGCGKPYARDLLFICIYACR